MNVDFGLAQFRNNTGHLYQVRYGDLLRLRQPSRLLWPEFELVPSRNLIGLGEKNFYYNNLETPQVVDGWLSVLMMPKEIGLLIHYLWELDWKAESLDPELIPLWKTNRLSGGDLLSISIDRLKSRLEEGIGGK